MIFEHTRIVQVAVVSCVLVVLLASGGIPLSIAQVLPPIIDPTPGSTLTSTTVPFTGEHASQAGEEHWLSVGTSLWNNSIHHQSLGTGHTVTVSGLPTSGILYVRYWTYTPVEGWLFQEHTYTMAADFVCGQAEGGPRFVVVNGSEVCDNTTGLNWEQTPDSINRQQPEALAHCPTLGPGYRLPEVKELISLVDYSQFNPALPLNNPFSNVPSAFYWSASTHADNPSLAWGVYFYFGNVDVAVKGRDNGFAWCVR